MSKRKQEDNYKHLLNKIKKLERQVNRKRTISSSSDEDYPVRPPRSCSSGNESENSVMAALGPQDWLYENSQNAEEKLSIDVNVLEDNNDQEVTQNEPGTSSAAALEQSAAVQLESDVLEILGEDPSKLNILAPDVHIEIARRFEHITTQGLTKEKRKELTTKYLTPENCPHIGAPGLNPEIKAALLEDNVKRDKAIEAKQTQMASALSCLAEVLSHHLNCQEKNNDMLSKLMDMGRLLCDIQHRDSITRRNFIFSNLKKEMKEHLSNTKIDKLLFSENLTEALKSARAVSKSGTELKPNQKKAPKVSTQKPLNRRAPAPARRPPGPPPRSREPAAPRAPPPPPPPQPYSRTSSHSQPPATRSWRR